MKKKMKSSRSMNALLGVSQGSVRPARTIDNVEMDWESKQIKHHQLLLLVKVSLFDTGGISIKPFRWNGGHEMGYGRSKVVVAGLMYTLALRKAKANVIGAVGLVGNMPDGNAQRPGEIL